MYNNFTGYKEDIIKIKKRYKFVIIVAVIFIVVKFIIANYHIVLRETSSDNKNQIIVQAHESFLFGPTPMTVRAKSKGILNLFKRDKYNFEVYNDGKTVRSSDVLLTWYDDEIALIQINCEESGKRSIKVNFNYEFKDKVKIIDLKE